MPGFSAAVSMIVQGGGVTVELVGSHELGNNFAILFALFSANQIAPSFGPTAMPYGCAFVVGIAVSKIR